MNANAIEPGEVFLVPLDDNYAAPAMITHVANQSRMLAAFGLVAVPRTIDRDGALKALAKHKTWRPIIGARGFRVSKKNTLPYEVADHVFVGYHLQDRIRI